MKSKPSKVETSNYPAWGVIYLLSFPQDFSEVLVIGSEQDSWARSPRTCTHTGLPSRRRPGALASLRAAAPCRVTILNIEKFLNSKEANPPSVHSGVRPLAHRGFETRSGCSLWLHIVLHCTDMAAGVSRLLALRAVCLLCLS